MKLRWKTYSIYAIFIILGSSLLFILTETVRAKNTGFETKTLWDWMDLLIIPLVLALGAFSLNRSEREIEREIASKRAELEREIAKDRQQEAALQNYIGRMSDLLLKEKLRATKRKEVSDVARTLTISTMRGLDKDRNNLIIHFLGEAKLIVDEKSLFNNVDMEGMNLRDLDFSKVFLQKAVLMKANLQEVAFLEANLQKAILWKANLQDALLWRTNLEGANLEGANLDGANLMGANLEGTFLSGARLKGTDFTKANLKGAAVAPEQLAQASSLKGAIMPDGTIHD